MVVKFKSNIGFLEKLKMHYISISKEVLVKTKTEDDKGSIYNQRFEILVNNTVKWKAGSTALGNEMAYITLSKARMKVLNVQFEDIVNIELTRDHSIYGFDVPLEFEEVLRQDPEANNRFKNLTMGKRRAIIYLVIQVKSSQKRIDKSIFLLENLKKSPVGTETMRHILGKETD